MRSSKLSLTMEIEILLLLALVNFGAGTVYKEKVQQLRQAFGSDFEPNIRPDYTVNVSMKFSLYSMEVSPEDQTLTVSGTLTMVWLSDKLWEAGNFGDVSAMLVAASEDWHPDIVIENSKNNMEVLHEDSVFMTLYSDGSYVWTLPVYTEVFCPMDLYYFPFDKHTCSLTMSSLSNSAEEISLQLIDDNIYHSSFIENPLWSITSANIAISETNSSLWDNHSKLNITLNFERVNPVYGIAVLLPVVVVSGLSLLVFLVPTGSEEKLTYISVVCLSYLLLHVKAMEGIPSVSSVPLISIYLTTVFLKLVLIILCTIMTMTIHHNSRKKSMSNVCQCVSRLLMKLTCIRLPTTDGNDDLLPGTPVTPHPPEPVEVSKRQEKAQDEKPVKKAEISSAGTPFVVDEKRPHGHLTPLPFNKISPANGRIKSSSTVKSVTNSQIITNQLELPPIPTWTQLADALNRLLFAVFTVVSFLIHVTLLLLLLTDV